MQQLPETHIGRREPMPISLSEPDGLGEEPNLECLPAEEVQLLPESRLVFHTDTRGPGADRYRYLRMRLRELAEAGKLRSLLITSALPQDGKSTTALNLATALAEQGKRSVLLIEADLHHPTLREQLGIKSWPGLAECLEDGLDPVLAVRRLTPLDWYLLPAGVPRGNPTELLQSDALSSVISKLSPHFDWILIDSPPLTPLTDALALARQVDASLLVVRAHRTPRDAVERAVELLGRKRVAGVVLNRLEGLDRVYSKYYGYYGRKAVPVADQTPSPATVDVTTPADSSK